MPLGLFKKKFSPSKPGPRKAVSLSTLQSLDRETLQRELNVNDNLDRIKLTLDGNKMMFDGNEWVSGNQFFSIGTNVSTSDSDWSVSD